MAVCEWKVNRGKVSGKELHLCRIIALCVLCFSERRKNINWGKMNLPRRDTLL